MSTIVSSINFPTVEPFGGLEATVSNINIPLPILKINRIVLNDDYVTEAINVLDPSYKHVKLDLTGGGIVSAKLKDLNPVEELRFADVDIQFGSQSFEAVGWGDPVVLFTSSPLEFGLDPTSIALEYTIKYYISTSSRFKEETLTTKIAF